MAFSFGPARTPLDTSLDLPLLHASWRSLSSSPLSCGTLSTDILFRGPMSTKLSGKRSRDRKVGVPLRLFKIHFFNGSGGVLFSQYKGLGGLD